MRGQWDWCASPAVMGRWVFRLRGICKDLSAGAQGAAFDDGVDKARDENVRQSFEAVAGEHGVGTAIANAVLSNAPTADLGA